MEKYMPKRKIVKQYKDEYYGQEITVNRVEAKNRKKTKTPKRTKTTCPNWMSTLNLDKTKMWVCSGDRLQIWQKEFFRYYKFDEKSKKRYLMNLSDSGKFLELFDRWVYSRRNNETFDCGYSNKIYPPLNSAVTKIPDPIFCLRIERKLGRPLTEEEIFGEDDLWIYNGQVLTKYRKNAKKIKIPFVLFPEEA